MIAAPGHTIHERIAHRHLALAAQLSNRRHQLTPSVKASHQRPKLKSEERLAQAGTQPGSVVAVVAPGEKGLGQADAQGQRAPATELLQHTSPLAKP